MKLAKGIRRYTGLMFRTRNTEALCFEFNKEVLVPIHSWFVFFPFIVIWKDSKDKVMEMRRVNPFQKNIYPRKPFRKLLEIPVKK